MTIKEELEQFMPKAKCINAYRVELLNDAFKPHKVFDFETLEEANAKYEELRHNGFYPGFLRKYAVVSF